MRFQRRVADILSSSERPHAAAGGAASMWPGELVSSSSGHRNKNSSSPVSAGVLVFVLLNCFVFWFFGGVVFIVPSLPEHDGRGSVLAAELSTREINSTCCCVSAHVHVPTHNLSRVFLSLATSRPSFPPPRKSWDYLVGVTATPE